MRLLCCRAAAGGITDIGKHVRDYGFDPPGNRAPSCSASSPPREVPETASRLRSISARRAIQADAQPKYSSGMRASSQGGRRSGNRRGRARRIRAGRQIFSAAGGAHPPVLPEPVGWFDPLPGGTKSRPQEHIVQGDALDAINGRQLVPDGPWKGPLRHASAISVFCAASIAQRMTVANPLSNACGFHQPDRSHAGHGLLYNAATGACA